MAFYRRQLIAKKLSAVVQIGLQPLKNHIMYKGNQKEDFRKHVNLFNGLHAVEQLTLYRQVFSVATSYFIDCFSLIWNESIKPSPTEKCYQHIFRNHDFYKNLSQIIKQHIS